MTPPPPTMSARNEADARWNGLSAMGFTKYQIRCLREAVQLEIAAARDAEPKPEPTGQDRAVGGGFEVTENMVSAVMGYAWVEGVVIGTRENARKLLEAALSVAPPPAPVAVAREGEQVASWKVPCPVCEGSGRLKEAVQAWDAGGPVPDCHHCDDGVLDLATYLVPSFSTAEPNDKKTPDSFHYTDEVKRGGDPTGRRSALHDSERPDVAPGAEAKQEASAPGMPDWWVRAQDFDNSPPAAPGEGVTDHPGAERECLHAFHYFRGGPDHPLMYLGRCPSCGRDRHQSKPPVAPPEPAPDVLERLAEVLGLLRDFGYGGRLNTQVQKALGDAADEIRRLRSENARLATELEAEGNYIAAIGGIAGKKPSEHGVDEAVSRLVRENARLAEREQEVAREAFEEGVRITERWPERDPDFDRFWAARRAGEQDRA